MLKDPRYSSTALNILLRFEEGIELGYTSTLILGQVLAHLAKRSKFNAMDKLYDYLDGVAITVIETKREDFEEARRLRSELGLPWRMWDDLVIASQMVRVNVKEIYSNDSDFDSIKGVVRIFK